MLIYLYPRQVDMLPILNPVALPRGQRSHQQELKRPGRPDFPLVKSRGGEARHAEQITKHLLSVRLLRTGVAVFTTIP